MNPGIPRLTAGLPPGGLPLTAFEEHMLADDRPTHPMVITMRLDFDGPPPLGPLTAAFEATLRNEPLLTARVRRPRSGRPRWVAGEPPRLLFSSLDEVAGEDDSWPGVPPLVDAAHGPVLQAEIVTRPQGWVLLLAVHHAAADGLGIVSFVERWLVAASGRETSQRRQAGSGNLARRGRVAASWWAFVRMLPGLTSGIQGVRQFMGRRVISIRGPADPAASSPANAVGPSCPWRPAVVTITLDETEVSDLEQRERTLGVTANDLLVAAYVAALGEMHAGLPDGADDGWIRIGVPMSLRTKTDYGLPAANRVSMVFLDRRPADRHDHESLVGGIHAEMDLIRSHELGHIFPLTLELGRLLPGGLRRVAERPAPQCTAVLSNLGRCFHRSPLSAPDGPPTLGTSRLTGWWIVPPVRPGTAVAAATHETAGRRTIALHFDPARLQAVDARRLLDATHAALRKTPDGLLVSCHRSPAPARNRP